MNPGIFYLYEYSNTQKLRNTGFLKLTRYYHSCTLQLNARSIPVSYAEPIKLYVFYAENKRKKAAFLTEITCANHALSARMTFAESDFPDGHSLEQLEGFFLLLPNGHLLVAAIPGIVIDTQNLLSAFDSSSEENPSDDMAPSDDHSSNSMTALDENSPNNTAVPDENSSNDMAAPDNSSSNNMTAPDNRLSDNTTPPDESTSNNVTVPDDNENESATADTSANERADRTEPETEMDAPSHMNANEAETTFTLEAESICNCSTENPSAEPEPQESHSTFEESNSPVESKPQEGQNTSLETCSPQQNVKKIQRSELSMLPRRYWHLANNSFLLHGYHNYNHLILVEKDGHYWLGVPGIYDPREARAARLFGFPQFTDSYNASLQLSDDECAPEEKFGYWCCYLR